jgi:fimbrial chaperone protein
MRGFSSLFVRALLPVLGLFGGAAFAAADFGVMPLRVDLQQGRMTGAVTLTNNTDAPVSVQAQLKQWSQHDGRDRLDDVAHAVATPPVFTLAPKSRQVVRVGVLVPPHATTEQTFRLLLTELPASAAPAGGQVATLLQLSLPVFVMPRTPPPTVPLTAVLARATLSGQPAWVLSLRNEGLRHAQVTGGTLSVAGAPWAERLGTYVLAGQTVYLPVRADAPRPANPAQLRWRQGTAETVLDVRVHD